ncbi:cutinase family protein [Dactylosporangium vinaceum]|uniref:Cutinase family protein n=1 Tax=Dactylosporangium vinaceum TaxID=53362 RepID=A0ABV5MHS9_9ACTN|nr:cutinase family protein [Dactylosporangium vinaceum]UAB99149.1 cutinase family protein [Dactylosporangium vinaceum]
MTKHKRRRIAAVVVTTAAILTAGALSAPFASASTFFPWHRGGGSASAAAGCADVEVVFARGTGERPGLGIVGTPLVRAIGAGLAGRTVVSHAVDYAADASQAAAGPGATEMSGHVAATAAGCPGTRFVLGGYSQGATVTDIAIGIQVGRTRGNAIPAALDDRVAAVVVFGNPLGIGRQTIAGRSAVFGPKAKEFCNIGDPVCGNGNDFAAHLRYVTNGSIQQAADFAVQRLTA